MVSGGTVRGDLSSIKSNMSTYSSTVSDLSSAWQGTSHDSLSSQVEAFASEFNGLINGQMESFASACDSYLEYEDIKSQIASLRSSGTKDENGKNSNSSKIASLEAKLAELKTKIEGLLSSVSGTITATATSTDSTSTSGVDAVSGASWMGLDHTYGTFTREVFTSSDGTQIAYMIYRPNYGDQNVTNLPVHMYMTGAGMKSTGEQIMTYGGIGKLLNEKNLNPSGIVIVPYVPSGVQYESEKYRKALAELPVQVCKDNNGDLNRISLSGHSYGAITAYNLVNENPDTFSAIVPVSGSKPPTEAFKNVKVWAFHGAQDNPGNNTDYRKAVKNIQAIQDMGGTATLHSYTEYPNCYHTHTANNTFSSTFEDPDEDKDEQINPLEWAFQQTKQESA